uniref:Putative ovule protein n=1 Tax=Solanum chacoense TaxID=4108 RepID=A0A0V0HVA8_SOLCH
MLRPGITSNKLHWWECFTLNQRSRVRALGMEKILLGAPPPNGPCRARSGFSRSSNVGSEHRVGNQKKLTVINN